MTDARPKRQRYPAEERRARMLDAAADFFADRGFEAPTRDIAGALGVTQALIYKHFASKEDLIERCLERAFAPTGAEQEGPWIDADAPLGEELGRYYAALAKRASDRRMRLFIRAGLDGRSWPTRRGHALTRHLFLPLIAGLRREAGLPGIGEQPATRGERERAMMLHASVVFLGIRRHIYRMPMPRDISDVVGLYVTTFLAGAIPAIRSLHAGGEDSLTVPLVAPRG